MSQAVGQCVLGCELFVFGVFRVCCACNLGSRSVVDVTRRRRVCLSGAAAAESASNSGSSSPAKWVLTHQLPLAKHLHEHALAGRLKTTPKACSARVCYHCGNSCMLQQCNLKASHHQVGHLLGHLLLVTSGPNLMMRYHVSCMIIITKIIRKPHTTGSGLHPRALPAGATCRLSHGQTTARRFDSTFAHESRVVSFGVPCAKPMAILHVAETRACIISCT